MYYEEELIEGILCHRNSPEGWIEFTLKELSERCKTSERKAYNLERQLKGIALNIVNQFPEIQSDIASIT